MIYLPILQLSSEFRLQAVLPQPASTRKSEQYKLRHHFNTRPIVCGARFLEAALSGSAEFQITGYIDGARGDRVSRANGESLAPLSNSPCNHFPPAIGR